MPVRGPGGIADKLEFDKKEPDRLLCGVEEAGGDPEAEAAEGRSA